MALLYDAILTPSKLELVDPWVRAQPWFATGGGSELVKVAAYRMDDPAGQVGIETLMLQSGEGFEGTVFLQVPLTYRDAPLDGAESFLIGTLEHSVLGTRYVYDAEGDPVYVAAARELASTGGAQAELFRATDDGPVRREPDMTVRGTGSPDQQPVSGALVVVRAPKAGDIATATVRIDGEWIDQQRSTTLVTF